MTDQNITPEEYVEPDLPIPADDVDDPAEYGPSYESPAPTKIAPREFKPWHRPRKQYVRKTQWLKSFKDLLDELPSDARTSATYLGLPGSDFLDVRLFAEECATRGMQLRYLGFDRTAAEDSIEGMYLNLSRDELNKSGNVDRRSVVMPDDLSTLGDRSSLAFKAANESSFDIVNLDLCGSATNQPGARFNSLYEALNSLLQVQSKRGEPWLLLLTAVFDRSGQSRDGKENAKKLVGNLDASVRLCEEARRLAVETFGATDSSPLPDLDTCADYVYAQLAILGFVQWLASISRQIRPSRFKIISIMSYRLSKDLAAPDMFSLAVKVKPKDYRIDDPAHLLVPSQPSNACEELTQHVGRVRGIKDADVALREMDEVFEEMRNSMADTLGSLRYDPQAYLESQFSMRIEDVTNDG